jgi:hypothetical protein
VIAQRPWLELLGLGGNAGEHPSLRQSGRRTSSCWSLTVDVAVLTRISNYVPAEALLGSPPMTKLRGRLMITKWCFRMLYPATREVDSSPVRGGHSAAKRCRTTKTRAPEQAAGVNSINRRPRAVLFW